LRDFIESILEFGQNAYLFVVRLKAMRKLLAIVRELIRGGASIESVGKSPISRAPGDVTQIGHN
jgi:hypothetical protein